MPGRTSMKMPPIYHVRSETGTTIMVAPMYVIAEAFGLHRDAVRRITFEIDQSKISECVKCIRFEITKEQP